MKYIYKLLQYFNLNTYEKRIEFFDTILSYITTNDTIKFIIIASLHYIIGTILVLYFIFSTHLYSSIFLICFILFIIIINIIDRGCLLMKLERKYRGKDWIGPYFLLHYIYKEKSMSTKIKFSYNVFFIPGMIITIFIKLITILSHILLF